VFSPRHDGSHAAPSAHALRPLSLLAAVRDVEGMRPGLYSAGQDLAASLRNDDITAELEHAVFDDQPWISAAPLVFAITADLASVATHFDEQGPHRGRDFAMIEAGALAQTLLLQAVDLGLGAVLVAGVRQERLQAVLHSDRHAVALIPIGHPRG
jgi:SagB-type dehydrogenase family enzyme